MDFKEVKELVELINSSNLAYFEIKTNDGYIKMDKSLTRNIESNKIDSSNVVKETALQQNEGPTNNISVNVKNDISEESKDEEVNIKLITSPMVGTFYSSPSPDSSAFVKEGDRIKAGDTLCILEAMKLMNEIDSDINGTIVKILVKEGQMVEYGEPLFKVMED